MEITERKYHIQLAKGEVGRYAILPGDPGRCMLIAEKLDSCRFLTRNREFETWVGELDGAMVSVTSTGIGGPSAAIAMEELSELGTDTFIRIGTCGGIDLPVRSGDLVIATGAVRAEGTSCEYAPIEYPAVPDIDVLLALRDAAESLQTGYHCGVVQCKDSFYGQHAPESMPVSYALNQKWDAYRKLHVKASEMESAALFVVAATRGLRCGSVFSVVWNQEREALGLSESACHDTSKAVDCAIAALRLLIAKDKAKTQ